MADYGEPKYSMNIILYGLSPSESSITLASETEFVIIRTKAFHQMLANSVLFRECLRLVLQNCLYIKLTTVKPKHVNVRNP